MDSSKNEDLSEMPKTTTTAVYVQAHRVEALNKAATKVNYETDSVKQMSPSELARYLIDSYLDIAVQKLIGDSKKSAKS